MSGTGGTGGRGGTSGTGGSAGTGGTGGSAGTGGSVDMAMPLDVPPADVGDATPADKSPDTLLCGLPTQSCCPINSCLAGGCCVAGKCVQMGMACTMERSCFANSCGGCGGLNERCCDNTLCVGANTTCIAGDGGATCRKCGGASEPCCAGNVCSDGLMCTNATCLPKP